MCDENSDKNLADAGGVSMNLNSGAGAASASISVNDKDLQFPLFDRFVQAIDLRAREEKYKGGKARDKILLPIPSCEMPAELITKTDFLVTEMDSAAAAAAIGAVGMD